MTIQIFTTGGTIDKIYFDQKSEFQVGDSPLTDLLREANVTFDYQIKSLIKKDSLDLTDDDRQLIFDEVSAVSFKHIVITHGTDTMIRTAQRLKKISGKVIVLTGSMFPARFRSSDAIFNIGAALTAVQILPHGVYLAINGHIFDPDHVQKNIKLNRFEEI